MKSPKLIALLFILCLAQTSWSFWGKDKPDSNWPMSREAKILEQTNHSEVLMEAKGYAKVNEYLDSDIKRAAVWYLLFAGTDPLLQNDEEKKAFDRIAEKFFTKVNQFIPWISPKVKSQRKINNASKWKKLSRTRELKINKSMLKKMLIIQGIMQARTEILEEAGLPFLMVLPEAPQDQSPLDVFDTNKFAKHTASVIESYLTSRQYEVQVPRAISEISQLVELTQGNIDQSFKLAMSVGADVYVTFSGTVDRQGNSHKAAVSIKAYETTTGRALGVETGYSKDRPLKIHEKALIEEACNEAIDKVLSRIDAYWKKDQSIGSQYRINMVMDDSWSPRLKVDVQDQVAEWIESKFKTYKEIAMSKKTMEYIIWAKPSQAKSASSLYRMMRKEIEQKIPGVYLSRKSLNKKLLILELKPMD